MANAEQFALLKTGVASWNKWRNLNVGVLPDLSQASLKKATLGMVQLTAANLSGTNLTNAVLRHANLRKAILAEANLTGSDLAEANFVGADLSVCIHVFDLGHNLGCTVRTKYLEVETADF